MLQCNVTSLFYTFLMAGRSITSRASICLANDTPNTGVNRTKPDNWKADVLLSVDMYNRWFMEFAPAAYRETRLKVTADVESTLHTTENLTNIGVDLLRANPGVLPTLRMSTCPPLAVDRLVGLAGVSKNLVGAMEGGKLPPRMSAAALERDLEKDRNHH